MKLGRRELQWVQLYKAGTEALTAKSLGMSNKEALVAGITGAVRGALGGYLGGRKNFRVNEEEAAERQAAYERRKK